MRFPLVPLERDLHGQVDAQSARPAFERNDITTILPRGFAPCAYTASQRAVFSSLEVNAKPNGHAIVRWFFPSASRPTSPLPGSACRGRFRIVGGPMSSGMPSISAAWYHTSTNPGFRLL